MPILQSNSPYIDKWRSTTVLLTAVTVLVALAGVFTPHSPVAAQGIAPTATATPTATSPPNPTPVPTAPLDGANNEAQPGGLFHELDGNPPPSIGVDTLASRLVGIDFGLLTQVVDAPVSPKDPVTGKPTKPQTLALNLFDDVVFTGLVEHIEPTSSGHALWGGLEGVELGTMTLVVNGSVVVGTVRTPDAVYTIRTAGGGAYVVRQIDESTLPPLGEPIIRGSFPGPDGPSPARPQGRGPTAPGAPDGTPTPNPTPTPISTMPTAPSERAPEEAPAGGLFSEVEGVPPPSTGGETLNSRLVGIDYEQLTQVTAPPISPKDSTKETSPTPQTLVLNLFDDVVFTGIVEDVEATSAGHALRGRLDGVGLGTFTLVVNGRVVIGTVRTPDAVYTIRTAGDGTYVIRQIDESSLPPLGEPLEGPLSTPEARGESDDVPPDDGSMIDVMVVYTPLAKRQEGGRAAIEALVDLFVAETNQANANSGVTHRIRLVLREEVEYTDTGTFLDIGRLIDDSDGYMDDVHERREQYAADLVHLVIGKAIDFCGVAVLEGPFGVTANLCGGLTFAHELGHNMGLVHDRYVSGVSVTGSNYGYVNQRMFDEGAPESARWRTIMSYSTQCWEVGGFYCPRVAYFSNPEVTYNGDPTGVPVDNPSTGVDGPADAVRTLNDRREITANFRRSSASPTPRVHLTLSPYWLAEDGGVSTVTAALHRPSSADTTVTVSASPANAVALSTNKTLTIPAGQTVSAGTVTITGVDNGNKTGDVIVEVSATVANPSSLGVIEPEPVALAIADDETTPVVTLSLSPEEIVEFEGRTFVTAMLDNRSSADTIVTVSAEPAELINEIEGNTLTIPAGHRASFGFSVRIQAVDNDELAEATDFVTVSGTAENLQGVAGPESVTLTIIDDEAPFFAADSIAYTFTAGIAGSRFLPEAAYGTGPLTYSLSPAPSNDVTFTSGPPARIGTSSTSVAGGETSYTLTVTDSGGVTDTMTIHITVRKGVCPNSAAVSGYADPGIVDDCEALLASLDALSVEQSLNWDEDLSIGEWQGVSIVEGRVVELDISAEGLTGTIPSELGSLANLVVLSLWGNQLTGEIPTELGSLANLQGLDLWGNQLTGAIPPELGDLSNLTVLFLHNNQLTGTIPPELGSLANLQKLLLSPNQLSGEIPVELGNLSNLIELSLWGNQLTGAIPSELGDLSNLRELVLSSNQLTGAIPPELGDLSNLIVLFLHNNQLTGTIPPELGNLSNLQWLYLGGNRLTGCVPDGLRGVPRNDFARLDLPFCSEHPCVVAGLVDATDLGLIADCETLLAARDTLAGTATLNWSADTPIADWSGVVLGGMSERVTELRLGGLGLNGRIPTELGSLTNLQYLNLSDNQLTGGIPTELGDLVNLQSLYLGGNRLTGCVPDGLRDVPNNDFARLDLPFCSEHPCVVAGLVDATDLGLIADCVTLLEARDTLAGTASLNWAADTPITQWDGVTVDETPQRVTELRLEARGLTGKIPAELGNLSNLRLLQLSETQLTGEIPAELGNLSDLQWLRLYDNQLTGEIPAELGNLSDLQWLWLWGNQLTGEIPTELGNLSDLQWLNLDDNQLTGEIPMELGNLSKLRGLDLPSNQLTGEIPAELGNLSDLQWLNLDDNQLTGEIPMELGNLSNLVGLSLWGNQLTGEIPTELGNLSDLQWLNLYDNQLTGEIPMELGNLSNLRGLWLSLNRLTGCIPHGLRDVPNNDLDRLGLSYCSVSSPEAPTIGTVTPGMDLLVISWGAPSSDGGSEITAYDLRYMETAADETVDSNWTVVEDVWTTRSGDLEYTVTGLTVDTEYDLQVRAVNAVGDGPWSATSMERTSGTSACVSEGVVPDAADNPGLVSDCEALLAARDVLATRLATGEPRLNWSADTPISEWDGIGEASLEGSPPRVTRLYLHGLWLDGSISGALAGLTELKELYLQGNELTGSISPRLGLLANLTHLHAYDNDLSGEIPPALGNLSALRELRLDSNDLSGQLPPELGRLTSVTRLWFADNDLSGTIPAELGNMTNLDWLNLGRNNIGGEIPAELGNLSRLRRLYIYENDLSGPLPGSLGNLSRLTHIVAQANDLSGEIPPEMGNLSNLVWMGLHDNDLTGEIPEELGNLAKLQRLYLTNNELYGPVPDQLGNLSELTNLFLSYNYLSGQIPQTLGDLGRLSRLRLAGNPFTGCLPAGLAAVRNSDADQLGLGVCSTQN